MNIRVKEEGVTSIHLFVLFSEDLRLKVGYWSKRIQCKSPYTSVWHSNKGCTSLGWMTSSQGRLYEPEDKKRKNSYLIVSVVTKWCRIFIYLLNPSLFDVVYERTYIKDVIVQKYWITPFFQNRNFLCVFVYKSPFSWLDLLFYTLEERSNR